MKKYNFILLLAALLFTAVAGFSQKKTKSPKVKEAKGVTTGGYSYKLYSTGKGDMFKTDDLVYFDLVIRHKDSIIQDSRLSPQQPEFIIRDKSEYTTPNPVIEALMLMRVNDSLIIFERIDTVQNLPPTMKDWKAISYSIKAKKVITEAQKKLVRDLESEIEAIVSKNVASYKANTLADVKVTPSGLKYLLLMEGKGPAAKQGESLYVHYYGASVSNGKRFDSSYSRGAAFNFPVGKGMVIPGWDEALLLLKKGSKAIVFIPAELAYGDQGISDTIEPNAELAFYMEVLE